MIGLVLRTLLSYNVCVRWSKRTERGQFDTVKLANVSNIIVI